MDGARLQAHIEGFGELVKATMKREITQVLGVQVTSVPE